MFDFEFFFSLKFGRLPASPLSLARTGLSAISFARSSQKDAAAIPAAKG